MPPTCPRVHLNWVDYNAVSNKSRGKRNPLLKSESSTEKHVKPTRLYLRPHSATHKCLLSKILRAHHRDRGDPQPKQHHSTLPKTCRVRQLEALSSVQHHDAHQRPSPRRARAQPCPSRLPGPRWHRRDLPPAASHLRQPHLDLAHPRSSPSDRQRPCLRLRRICRKGRRNGPTS